jgi:hypothetical protein
MLEEKARDVGRICKTKPLADLLHGSESKDEFPFRFIDEFVGVKLLGVEGGGLV